MSSHFSTYCFNQSMGSRELHSNGQGWQLALRLSKCLPKPNPRTPQGRATIRRHQSTPADPSDISEFRTPPSDHTSQPCKKFKWPFSIFTPSIRSYVENAGRFSHMWKINGPIFHVYPFNMVIDGKCFHPIGVICGK